MKHTVPIETVVSEIERYLYFYCAWLGQEINKLAENGFNWMIYVQSKRGQLEIILIPVTCFNNTWVLKKFKKPKRLPWTLRITRHFGIKKNSWDFCICTVEYGQKNWPTIKWVVTEGYNKKLISINYIKIQTWLQGLGELLFNTQPWCCFFCFFPLSLGAMLEF